MSPLCFSVFISMIPRMLKDKFTSLDVSMNLWKALVCLENVF
jgi:hypothetical protein